jgi:hypothetical protein
MKILIMEIIYKNLYSFSSKASDVAENYDYTSDYEKKYKEYLQVNHIFNINFILRKDILT